MKVAGIDVSSKTVTLVIHRDGRMGKPCELKNTPQEGHAPLSNRLRKAKVSLVCLEATGQLSPRPRSALALDDAGLARMVINPKQGRQTLRRGHADPYQIRCRRCRGVGQFAQRMPFTPWQRPDDLALPIRACARHIAATYDHIRNLKGQDDPIIFMDATHPQHNPVLAVGWIRCGEEQLIPTNTGRRRVNINGAIDLERLEPVVRFDDTINAHSTIALFEQLVAFHP